MKTRIDALTGLDALLAHNTDNPLVRMVRSFFFYPEVSAGSRRLHSGHTPHRKFLAH
ncbi:MAG: hypothetical protein K0Q91_500 [Fibrobacteria bacterium]|jgi:hypothetical protein|nr:hypothetical protein [Fibrobacteria bacterium]